MAESLAALIDRQGFAVLAGVVDAARLAQWCAAVAEVDASAGGEHARRMHAARNLLDLPAVAMLTAEGPLHDIAASVLGPDAFAVRGILFNKTPDANWKVTWHQDRAIAVQQRIDVPGFGPWSVKEGVVHVEPPVETLENMITLRLHLDDCDVDNGPLRVIAGSHRDGILDAQAIANWRATKGEQACTTDAGGVVVMRPLLLHASSPASQPRSRRVIHIEYAAGELPGGLRWRYGCTASSID